MSVSIGEFKQVYRQDKVIRVMFWIMLGLLGVLAILFALTYDRMFNTEAWQAHVRHEAEAGRMTTDGKYLYIDPDTGCRYFRFTSKDGTVYTPRYGKDGRVMGCGQM